MSRPIVGRDLVEFPPIGPDEYVPGMELRDGDGVYWRFEADGLCYSMTGGAGLAWGLPRVLDASNGPVIVVYVPPIPPPHTAPGWYLCTGLCAYRFVLHDGGLWAGPWTPEGMHLGTRGIVYTWTHLEESYGDCTRSLVGPIDPRVLAPVRPD